MIRTRIAASVRFIYAMFQLYAAVEDQFGKSLISILKKNYPDQEIDIEPASLGHKLMAIARKQLQYNDTDAMDAIQDLLTYLSVGSMYETDAKGRITYDDDTGEPLKRTTPKPWDFAKDSPTWQKALDKIYTNLRTTAISRSMGKTVKQKREKPIDKAFGVRPEGGGAPEGGEARVPDLGDSSPFGAALDDKAAIKEFMDLIDEHIDDLRNGLTPDSRALFDLVFTEGVGSFGSDIKENMGQASALKEKYPDMYAKNQKRWSGFVGDLRKRLLDEIWRYIDREMSYRDYQRIKEAFFGETTPSDIKKLEQKKIQEKEGYQSGIDSRKLADYKWMEQQGVLPKSEESPYESLKKKLIKQNVDVDSIEPTRPKEYKLKRLGIPESIGMM